MASRQEINKIQQLQGEVRGVVFETDFNYIKDIREKEEIKKVEKKIQEVEPNFSYKQIQNTKWYPLKWRIFSLLFIKETFNWSEDEIYEMGRAGPRSSFMVKTLLRYFLNFHKTCREAEKYWGKHYSLGKLELVEFNNKDKKAVYRLKNFSGHPVFCRYLTGYIQAIAELAQGNPEIKARETKCALKKDSYHEFILTNWT